MGLQVTHQSIIYKLAPHARARVTTVFIAGGFIGARVAKRMPVAWLRAMVIAVGFALTLIYTWQYWIRPFYS